MRSKTNQIKTHFDEIANRYDSFKQKYGFYYTNLKSLLSDLIPYQQKVLEIGCGTGDLLTHLRPKVGYGIDLSPQMIKIAKSKHKKDNLFFSCRSIASFKSHRFDYIFASDVIEHLPRLEDFFKEISLITKQNTKFICTIANPLWEPVLMFAEKLHLKMPEGPHCRWSFDQIKKTAKRHKLKIIEHDFKLLLPINLPIITNFVNQYLEPYLKRHAFIEYFVATKNR